MSKNSIFYLVFLCSISLFSQENISVVGLLPDIVSETSGLIFYDGKLITHNDSGGRPQLYEIDTTSLEITRTVTIENVENIDWEDIAQDETHIYIGDFGNNVGTRTDLRILKISKSTYDISTSIPAEVISFSYQDQFDFIDNGPSDWDAEALFVLNDQLIILTKQWQSMGTKAYAISKIPGHYQLEPIDDFQIDGLVTGATFNPITETLFIIGYTSVLTPFTFKISSITQSSIFTDLIERTDLNVGLAQMESITYVDGETYFLSSEFFSRSNPSITLETQLYTFKEFSDEPEPMPEPEPEPNPEEGGVFIFQRPGFELLEYEINLDEQLLGRAIYDISGRQVSYTLGNEIEEDNIELSTLQNSVYYLTFYFATGIISVPFIKN